jgi:hypothetical protein
MKCPPSAFSGLKRFSALSKSVTIDPKPDNFGSKLLLQVVVAENDQNNREKYSG